SGPEGARGLRWPWTAQTSEAAYRLDPDTPLPELPATADDDAHGAWAALTHTLRLRRELRLAFSKRSTE
ncbi:hypothetical protein, partial [Deinococcus pimensis]|uniref:hypothetical protein n=1 Tax=Deinococcus pimensis TaxID=309888 RepID=UPI000486C409